MSLLRKENFVVYFLLTLFTGGFSSFLIAYDLKLFEKGAWYTKWYFWVIGVVLLILPALVMVQVLNIKMQIEICKKLEVPGVTYYGYPYLWILCLIIPIIGWATFLVMLLHIFYYPVVPIYQGKGDLLSQP